MTKRKSFPANLELEFAAPLSGDGTIVTFHYSIRQLPDPRGDDFSRARPTTASGYFLTAIKDFTKGDPKEGRFVRFVNRWDLTKADPTLRDLAARRSRSSSTSRRPSPSATVAGVEAGILEWNKAFEKCGFSGAIVVRQQTADNEFKDFDPEDVRYNFFRWITSEQAFAMGPSRVDPRTGTDPRRRHHLRRLHGSLLPPRLRAPARRGSEALPSRESRVGKPGGARAERRRRPFAEPRPRGSSRSGSSSTPIRSSQAFERLAGTPGGRLTPSSTPITTLAQLSARIQSHPESRAASSATAPRKSSLSAARSRRSLDRRRAALASKDLPEDFMGEVIKETVMHEVGHTLGLRHNFKGSSWSTLAEINSADRPRRRLRLGHGLQPAQHCAPRDSPRATTRTRTIGPYDFWAIEYGYAPASDGQGDLDPADARRDRRDARGVGPRLWHRRGPEPTRPDDRPLGLRARTRSPSPRPHRARAKAPRRSSRAPSKTGEGWEQLRGAFAHGPLSSRRARGVAAAASSAPRRSTATTRATRTRRRRSSSSPRQAARRARASPARPSSRTPSSSSRPTSSRTWRPAAGRTGGATTRARTRRSRSSVKSTRSSAGLSPSSSRTRRCGAFATRSSRSRRARTS